MHGSGGSRPSSSKSSGVPIPRRLAYPRQLQQPSPVAHSDGHEHVQAARPPPERRKVHFGTNTEVRLYRGSTGLHSRPGVSSRGSFSGPYNHHTQPSELPNVNGPLLPQPPRSHGVLHFRDSSRQVAPPTSPGMALLSIPAAQTQLGPDFDGTITGPGLPQLVARPQEGAGRCSIPSTSAIPSLNHGCVIAQLGSPFTEPPNTGPVVAAGIDPAHQCQGTASGTPCLSSLRLAFTGSLCHHPYRQHNGHALHQQTRRGTLLPALPRSDSSVGLLHSPLHSPGSLFSPRGPEHLGGPTEQVLPDSRVVHSTGRYPLCLPEVGISPHRPIHDSREPEIPRVLLTPGSLPRLPDRRFSPALDGPPVLCLPATWLLHG
ncbi:uncharacterized protein RBU57_008144 [Macrochelys suwanniensis]